MVKGGVTAISTQNRCDHSALTLAPFTTLLPQACIPSTNAFADFDVTQRRGLSEENQCQRARVAVIGRRSQAQAVYGEAGFRTKYTHQRSELRSSSASRVSTLKGRAGDKQGQQHGVIPFSAMGDLGDPVLTGNLHDYEGRIIQPLAPRSAFGTRETPNLPHEAPRAVFRRLQAGFRRVPDIVNVH